MHGLNLQVGKCFLFRALTNAQYIIGTAQLSSTAFNNLKAALIKREQ